jgi:hypothetical protein
MSIRQKRWDLSYCTLQNWFGIFLIFLLISMNFLRLWTDLQENLDRFYSNQVLTFTRNTLNKFKSSQSSPWPGRAVRVRPNPASRRRSRPGKRPWGTTCSPRSGREPEGRWGFGWRRAPAAASGGDRGGSVDDGVGVECWQTSDGVSFNRGQGS